MSTDYAIRLWSKTVTEGLRSGLQIITIVSNWKSRILKNEEE